MIKYRLSAFRPLNKVKVKMSLRLGTTPWRCMG